MPTILGDGACPLCGATMKIKLSEKGKPTAICPLPGDGGCATQFFTRSQKGAALFVKGMKRWRDTEARKKFTGDMSEAEAAGPAPAPSEPSEPEAAPEAAPAPAPKPPRKNAVIRPAKPAPAPAPAAKKPSFWDQEL